MYSVTFFPSLPEIQRSHTLYKLLNRSILTYAVPVWSSTCSSNYLRLSGIQSKCLWVISNHPRLTPTSLLHNTLNVKPILIIIHRLTVKFFAHCPSHPNPLVQQMRNCTVANLTNVQEIYTSRTEAYTSIISLPKVAVFFFLKNFSLPLFTLIYIHFCFTCVIVYIFIHISWGNSFVNYTWTCCTYFLCSKS